MFDWLLKRKSVQPTAGNEPAAAPPRADAVQVSSPEAVPAPPEPEYKPNPKELSILALIKAAQGVDERCDTKNLHRLRVALRDFHSIVVMGEMPEPKKA